MEKRRKKARPLQRLQLPKEYVGKEQRLKIIITRSIKLTTGIVLRVIANIKSERATADKIIRILDTTTLRDTGTLVKYSQYPE